MSGIRFTYVSYLPERVLEVMAILPPHTPFLCRLRHAWRLEHGGEFRRCLRCELAQSLRHSEPGWEDEGPISWWVTPAVRPEMDSGFTASSSIEWLFSFDLKDTLKLDWREERLQMLREAYGRVDEEAVV